jgi:hypothetical protein
MGVACCGAAVASQPLPIPALPGQAPHGLLLQAQPQLRQATQGCAAPGATGAYLQAKAFLPGRKVCLVFRRVKIRGAVALHGRHLQKQQRRQGWGSGWGPGGEAKPAMGFAPMAGGGEGRKGLGHSHQQGLGLGQRGHLARAINWVWAQRQREAGWGTARNPLALMAGPGQRSQDVPPSCER